MDLCAMHAQRLHKVGIRRVEVEVPAQEPAAAASAADDKLVDRQIPDRVDRCRRAAVARTEVDPGCLDSDPFPVFVAASVDLASGPAGVREDGGTALGALCPLFVWPTLHPEVITSFAGPSFSRWLSVCL